MGYGIGVLGLKYDDFCRLTPEEFEETCKSWNEINELRQRQEWERIRTLGVMAMQPHCKKKIIPEKILPFPWDEKNRRKEKPLMSRDEQKKRFERLLASQDS